MSTRQVAALDLGSNSFHLVVAEESEGVIKYLDRHKEMVRLASGLDANNILSDAAMQRALACLGRMGERLQAIPAKNLRIVGTNTLRRARNSRMFLEEAEKRLGHPVEVIAGREEARLIYLGVSHALQVDGKHRLVVDIGGGSTEFILGRQFKPKRMESLHMGCVSYSQKYFPDGVINAAHMADAILAARQECESIRKVYRKQGWDVAIGASGTIRAVARIVGEAQLGAGLTMASLTALQDQLCAIGHVGDLDLPGLRAERAAVLPGGLAVLIAAFTALNIEQMTTSEGALREGVIYDLLGRIKKEDVREQTVQWVAARYDVDGHQAQKVSATAIGFLHMHGGCKELGTEILATRLRWAATLHEIGLAVGHSQYQKHGAYLLNNMDMPGFALEEQHILAAIVLGHRRKYPRQIFDELSNGAADCARLLCVLLRLSVLLHRSRHDEELPEIAFNWVNDCVLLKFPGDWLENHPLTRADLKQESGLLKQAKLKLCYS